MSRSVFLLGVALTLGLSLCLAPAASAGGFGVGFKAGLNFATVSGLEDDIDAAAKADFVGGAFGWLGLNPNLSLYGEVLYSRRSVKLTEMGEENTLKHNFLEIPAYLSYGFATAGIVKPRIYAGASASFETGCDVDLADGTATNCEDAFGGVGFNSALWAIIGGAAVDVHLGSFFVLGDVRYNYGLNNIVDMPDDDTKYQYFTAFVGIGFGLGS